MRTFGKYVSRSCLLKNGTAVVLFGVFAVIYWVSVPNGFNTVRENRRFFDSDGEFITRQFKQGSTYTHQDHLLYHILATTLHASSDYVPGLPKDPVAVHKILSVFFGALGITCLFLFGLMMTKRLLPSLLAALFVAGSAGYWFFSATIDTYVPSLCFCIVALGLTLKWLTDQSMSTSVTLGASMGIAFLFRTDGFLLGSLGLAGLGIRRRWYAKLLPIVLAGAIVSGVGYAGLAHHVYKIDYKDVPSWSRGHLDRREVGENWGVIKNLTLENIKLVLVNQVFYTVFLPGLESTADPDFCKTMTAFRYGGLILSAYLLFLLLIVASTIAALVRYWRNRQLTQSLPIVLGLSWFISRTLFYTWWNPYEPFLFAVMSIPALWLFCLIFLQEKPHTSLRLGGMTLIVILVWGHNLAHLILPLRALPF